MNSIGERIGRWVIRRRWWIILGTLMSVGLLAKGALLLPIQNDVRIYFGEDSAQLNALEALERVYTKNDSVFFIVAPKDGNVFSRKTLSAIKELTELSWQLPFSSRVDSITNFQHTNVEGDELVVEDLVPSPEGLSDSGLLRVKKIALAEPRLQNLLISEDGHVTGVRANMVRPNLSMNETPQVAAFARNMVKEFKLKYPDIDIYLTGEIIQDVALSEATVDDMTSLIPLMYLAMFVIMMLLLRSILRTLLVFTVIGFSVASSMGLGGWLGLHLNPTTATAPLIILTLAISDSIHLLLMISQLIGRGMPKHEAIARSVELNLKPVLLTSITTAVGFLSMNYAEAIPFREFGNFVGFGVVAACFYSVLFLPAATSILPFRVRRRKEKKHTSFDGFADFVIRHKTPIMWTTMAVTLLVSAGITQIKVTDNFNRWYDKRYDFRNATDFMEEHLTGIDIIEYSLNSGGMGGIHDPEYLAKVEAFANWYRKQPHVVHVSTINDTLKRINQDMHEGDPSYYRIPETRELAAQYLLLYEMSLPFGHDLNNRIDIDKSATRMSVRVKDSASQLLLDLDENAHQWLEKYGRKSMVTDGTGLSMMYAHLIRNNTNSMFKGSFIALLIVMGILILTLRLFKLSLAILIPNLGPIVMGFGIWGHFFGHAGIAISLLISMTLGIVVDDSIHFLTKYMKYRREHGATPAEAVRYTFHTVGQSLVVTTIILGVGFSILSFSGFGVNKDMSIITVIIISLALAFDLLLLPTLLMKAEERTNEKYDMEPYATAGSAALGCYERR